MRAGGISELKIYEGSEPGKWCTKTSVTFVRARCHNLRSPGGPRQWGFKQILWGNLRPTNFQFIFVLRRPAKANAGSTHLHVCVSFFRTISIGKCYIGSDGYYYFCIGCCLLKVGGWRDGNVVNISFSRGIISVVSEAYVLIVDS